MKIIMRADSGTLCYNTETMWKDSFSYSVHEAEDCDALISESTQMSYL